MSVIQLTDSNKKRRIRREGEEDINKKSHLYTFFTPKYCRKDQRSYDGRWGGGGGPAYFIASVVQWKEKNP